MTETTKIRLINAYANLLDVFAKNSEELGKNMRYSYGEAVDYNNICKTIDHLSNEIQSIKFSDEIKVEVKINESNTNEHQTTTRGKHS